jgi:hypothetical protein
MHVLSLMIGFWLAWTPPDDSGVCWRDPKQAGFECTVSSDGELGISYRNEGEARALCMQGAIDRLDGLCRRGGWDGVTGVGFSGPFCHLDQPVLVTVPLRGAILMVTIDDGDPHWWCMADAIGTCFVGSPPGN